MKTKIILWGTGRISSAFVHFIDYDKAIIEAFVDNDEKMWGKKGLTGSGKYIPVISPDMLGDYMDEKTIIIIVSSYYSEIKDQLHAMQIPDNKIVDGVHAEIDVYDKRLENVLLSNYLAKNNIYEIEGFKVKLSTEHRLQQYKRRCLMYNEFVPYLGRLEEILVKKSGGGNSHWIIDIGANVGDTSLGMVKYTSADILAVEPTECYYQLLIENISEIDIQYSNRIKPVQAYISNDENKKLVSLRRNGTAVAVASPDEKVDVPTISIKNLLSKYNIDVNSVNLIKVDTDGFDFECIMSCGELLKSSSPVLYYENQIDTRMQYEKYIEMYEYLSKCKYTHYFVFDNYGNYMGCMDNEALKSLNRYLVTMNNYWSVRTFWYVDVLACKEGEKENVKEIVEQYLKNYSIERYV